MLLLPCAALVPLLWGTADWSAPRQSLLPLKVAIDKLRKVVPPGSVIFTDYRTGAVISYYLGRNGSNIRRSGLDHFRETEAGSYCIVHSPLWTPDPKAFGDEVERLVRIYRLPSGQRFWVIRQGGEYDLTLELARRFPGSVFPVLSRSGNISAVELWP